MTAEAQRTYRARHPERVRESKRLYAERHPDAARIAQAKYEAAHPEYKRGKNRRYAQSEHGRVVKARLRSEWKKRNPEWVREHTRIQQRVRRAVERGFLVKRPCEVCGDPIVHGHHHKGYAPEHELDVVWLCVTHHVEAHR